MALNENVKNLIQSVVDNDLQKAKSYVKVIISNETATSNQYFCKTIKSKLQTQLNFIELPYDIRGIFNFTRITSNI